MRHSVKDVVNFENFSELEADYYGSRHLEVRAGIIHALLHGAYHIDQFPRDWRVKFLLSVCREFATEAHIQYRENRRIPYSQPGAPHEDTMRNLTKKNACMSKWMQFSKIAGQCILFPMGVYIGDREWSWGGEITETDKGADELIDMMADWTIAPYLNLRSEPQKKTVGKFLEVYEKQHSKSVPNKWFQAVICSRHLNLFWNKPWEEVRKQLIAYLNESVVWEWDEFPDSEKVTLSAFTNPDTKHGFSGDIAQHLVGQLHKRGELDSFIQFGDR